MDIHSILPQHRHESPDPLANRGNGNEDDGPSQRNTKSSNPHERWSKLPKARGRQPRDPQGQAVKFQCRDTDDMERSLRNYLSAPTGPAEHTTIEFMFPVSSAFMVYAADFKNVGTQNAENGKQYGKLDRTAISVLDALTPGQDAKDRMRRQKAIAKVCVEACEQADGFRYSFHNNWLSREDEACRFSYFCNDSTLNKGRAANEGAGMAGKKKRKPVFNCQGLVAIKFSSTKQNLEVHYKHVPLHPTWAERAPPVRVEGRKRTTTDTTDTEKSPVKSRKRTNVQVIDLSQEVELEPMDEFLEFADITVADREPQAAHNDGDVHHQLSVSGAKNSSTENAYTEIRPALPKKPSIPGAMVGSVRRGFLNWTARAPTTRHYQPSSNTNNVSIRTQEPQPAINEAASNFVQDTASIALSELLALRKKLEEAEERIKRLESEKSPIAAQVHMPPQHVLWPPPPGYAQLQQPPPQSQSSDLYLSQQSHMHTQPPSQQHFPRDSEDPLAGFHTPVPAPTRTTTTAATTEAALPETQKSKKKKARKTASKTGLIGSKFVPYTPKAKKLPDHFGQNSAATSTRASSAVNGE